MEARLSHCFPLENWRSVKKKKRKHDDEGKFIERKKIKECTAGPVRAGLISRVPFQTLLSEYASEIVDSS